MDNFNGDVIYISYQKVNVGEGITFRHFIKKNGIRNYDMTLESHAQEKNDMYSKRDVEINIDGEIFSLDVIGVSIIRFDYLDDIINCTVSINKSILEKIESAKKVSIRFYKESGMNTTINISNIVLTEWKDVISKEK